MTALAELIKTSTFAAVKQERLTQNNRLKVPVKSGNEN